MCASGAVHVDCHGLVYACVGLLLHFDVVYGMDQRYFVWGGASRVVGYFVLFPYV